jgi:hypothetical protein
VGGRKQSIIVSRYYSPAPDQCVRALEVLLNKPVTKEGSPTLATLDDAKVRSFSDDSRARPRIP